MVAGTRFAARPSCVLRLASGRTAIFSWRYARRHDGKFILRIEDPDMERSTEANMQDILDGMSWLGLDAEQRPAYQTQRF